MTGALAAELANSLFTDPGRWRPDAPAKAAKSERMARPARLSHFPC